MDKPMTIAEYESGADQRPFPSPEAEKEIREAVLNFATEVHAGTPILEIQAELKLYKALRYWNMVTKDETIIETDLDAATLDVGCRHVAWVHIESRPGIEPFYNRTLTIVAAE